MPSKQDRFLDSHFHGGVDRHAISSRSVRSLAHQHPEAPRPKPRAGDASRCGPSSSSNSSNNSSTRSEILTGRPLGCRGRPQRVGVCVCGTLLRYCSRHRGRLVASADAPLNRHHGDRRTGNVGTSMAGCHVLQVADRGYAPIVRRESLSLLLRASWQLAGTSSV